MPVWLRYNLRSVKWAYEFYIIQRRRANWGSLTATPESVEPSLVLCAATFCLPVSRQTLKDANLLLGVRNVIRTKENGEDLVLFSLVHTKSKMKRVKLWKEANRSLSERKSHTCYSSWRTLKKISPLSAHSCYLVPVTVEFFISLKSWYEDFLKTTFFEDLLPAQPNSANFKGLFVNIVSLLWTVYTS